MSTNTLLFRKHFSVALGYAGWLRAARIAWLLSRSADAPTIPAPGPFDFGGDLGKTVQLVVQMEQVNAVQWSATSNHSARIVRQADAHEALRLALADAGAKSGEVPPVDCYIGWARFTERSMVFCDSDAPGAFRVYRAAVSGMKGAS
jgi:hypothetical protein